MQCTAPEAVPRSLEDQVAKQMQDVTDGNVQLAEAQHKAYACMFGF